MIPSPEGIHKHQFVAASSVAFPIINLAKTRTAGCFSRGICQYNWNIFHLTCIISVLTRSIVAPLTSARGASLVAKNGVSFVQDNILGHQVLRCRKVNCIAFQYLQQLAPGYEGGLPSKVVLAKRPQHPLFQATQKCFNIVFMTLHQRCRMDVVSTWNQG